MGKFTFRKHERLCSQRTIGEMFSGGESFLAYPLKVVFLKTALTPEAPVQAAFSVSKRSFKRAVKRNLLKRRMREAFRLNKPDFAAKLSEKDVQVAVMFIYIAREELGYSDIEKGMAVALKKLGQKL
jgi:ribonuclease P protein component